jgi:hypothetical protein
MPEARLTLMREEGLGLCSEEQIRRFESEHGIVLPSEYVEFLLTQNGGYPTPEFVPFEGHPHIANVWVSYILGLYGGDHWDKSLEWALAAGQADGIPEGHLPITSGNDWFTIEVGSRTEGAVYFWDHEDVWEESDIVPWRQADSFGQFLSQIASFRPDE